MTRRPRGSVSHIPGRLRCAIYTRKSSEEGLEQDFNSLHAQREACEAYIASQKREGWQMLPDLYDDGGYSGGTIERPAFQRLLADVAAGRIDTVVVYKVDRLTRSLSDFARIVEIFDRHAVSFVSVTQQFNTTTSMGRLTLNILLSFAQFEREVTGERIRDKISASKKKGLWMGGMPPLGYDVKDRKLVVNPAEAETVRHIFRRYAEIGSVRQLKADLDAQGIVSKRRIASDGSAYGGQPLARGALYRMLQNRIYRGETVHKDRSYPGEHESIVSETLWDQVQAALRENRVDRAAGAGACEPSLLAGRIFDAQGDLMTPTHANKKGVRYRYYVSRSLLGGSNQGNGLRVPAPALEDLVIGRIRESLSDPQTLLGIIQQDICESENYAAVIEEARSLATGASSDLYEFLRKCVASVRVHPDRIDVTLDQTQVQRRLDGDGHQDQGKAERSETDDGRMITISVAARLRRAGKEMRILVDDATAAPNPDPSLLRLLVRANIIREKLFADRSLTLEEIAKAEGVVPSYATRLFRLTLLAPDIVSAIVEGRQPSGLTARRLMDDTRLPLDWQEQRRSLGFIPAH